MNYCVSNHSTQSPNRSNAVIDTDADDDVCVRLFIMGTCEFHYMKSWFYINNDKREKTHLSLTMEQNNNKKTRRNWNQNRISLLSMSNTKDTAAGPRNGTFATFFCCCCCSFSAKLNAHFQRVIGRGKDCEAKSVRLSYACSTILPFAHFNIILVQNIYGAYGW